MDTPEKSATEQHDSEQARRPTAPLSSLKETPEQQELADDGAAANQAETSSPEPTADALSATDQPADAHRDAVPAAEPAADDGTAAAPASTNGDHSGSEPWWVEPEPAAAAAEEAAADDAYAEQDLVTEAAPAAVDAADPADENIADGTRQLSPEHVPSERPRSATRGLAFGALRDTGQVRKVNQDSIYALLTTLPREDGDQILGLFVVADGMGGHEGGEVASRLAIRTVAQQILSQLVMPSFDNLEVESLQDIMVGAIEEANHVIWEQAQRNQTDMGTTCTAVLLLGTALFVAHVGDSRAYALEYGHLEPITSDHSAVGRLIELGQLDPSEAHEHPLRNQLYRTIGQQPEVEVDFTYQKGGDASHLLLCSDGLWGMVRDEVMCRAIIDNPWPRDACRELIALANLAGGEDNISAIVVMLPSAERRSQ